MAFAFGWTPCIGPVLGGVLGLAATRSTLASGVSCWWPTRSGLGVPFLATGLAFGRLTDAVRPVPPPSVPGEHGVGAALVVFGVLLLTNNLHWLSSVSADVLRASVWPADGELTSATAARPRRPVRA